MDTTEEASMKTAVAMGPGKWKNREDSLIQTPKPEVAEPEGALSSKRKHCRWGPKAHSDMPSPGTRKSAKVAEAGPRR